MNCMLLHISEELILRAPSNRPDASDTGTTTGPAIVYLRGIKSKSIMNFLLPSIFDTVIFLPRESVADRRLSIFI